MNELEWLLDTSRRLGSDSELVQGTGGNISVKSGSKMYIKSSGVRIDSIGPGAGYSIIDHNKIVDIYSQNVDEKDADMAVLQSVTYGGRSSIETGFHSFLGKYVIHLHIASLNTILCSVGSKKLL